MTEFIDDADYGLPPAINAADKAKTIDDLIKAINRGELDKSDLELLRAKVEKNMDKVPNAANLLSAIRQRQNSKVYELCFRDGGLVF